MERVWNDIFYDLFRETVGRYHEDHRSVDGFFTDQEIIFLSSIGCRTREFYDLVESYARGGIPSPTTALLIAAARRDFFLTIQHGHFYQGKPVISYDLPGFGEEISGLPYLPRMIAKARAKLTGSMGEDIMYGCENDCRFLQDHGNIHPADFLRMVWAAGESNPKIYEYVRQSALAHGGMPVIDWDQDEPQES